MLKKRVVLWAGGLLALAALGALGLLVWPAPRHHITAARFADIRAGMTTQEIEAILGVPPGDYGTGQVSEIRVLSSGPGFAATVYSGPFQGPWDWVSQDAVVSVCGLDPEGRATEVFKARIVRRPESLLDRLRRWLRL